MILKNSPAKNFINVMNKSDLQIWVKKLGKAWSRRDAKTAANLFAKDCKYYESSLERPLTKWNDILNL